MGLTLAWKSESAYDRPTMVRSWVSVEHRQRVCLSIGAEDVMCQATASSVNCSEQIKVTELAFALREVVARLVTTPVILLPEQDKTVQVQIYQTTGLWHRLVSFVKTRPAWCFSFTSQRKAECSTMLL